MRILFATGSAPRYMAPPRLAADQIVCGPDFSDEQDAAGRWRSLRTPLGAYDLATVLARLPSDQQPHIVVCLVDAARRSLPRNLATFHGPRVLLVADTHHLKSPLIGMLRYATSEPFTRTVLLYDRHHAGIFRSAGVRNLFWFPGLTFPHDDATVRSARARARARRIAFVGQAGGFHPRRGRLMAAIRERGLPIDVRPLPQDKALGFYGASSVGFNASLNGDLNLRVFEILASGAALVTDRLSAESGLEEILHDGREYCGYDDAADLADVLLDTLAHPERTRAIGEGGARWFDAHFNETLRRTAFSRLALDGVAPAPFTEGVEAAKRVYFPGNLGALLRSVVAYEHVQELHRTQDEVRIALPHRSPSDVSALLATLPRVRFVDADVDLSVVSQECPTPTPLAPAVWCWDAPTGDLGLLDAALGGAGYVRNHGTVPLYQRRLEPATPRDERRHIVIYTDDPESGGVAQYNHTIALALARAGYRVTCVQSEAENPLIAAQRAAGVEHRWIWYHTGKDFSRTVTDAGPASALFRTDPPDLVIFSNCCPFSSLAAREVARTQAIPYVCVEGFVGAYLAERFQTKAAMLARQYAEARAIVAVSEENRQLLVARFGAPAERTQVIHYGRPERFFAPRNPEVRARLRAELPLPEDAILVLTTARLTAVKGYQHQLRALAELTRRGRGKRLHLVWAGDGDQRTKLEQAVWAAGLAGRVHLLGHRWDVADWYDAADAFVLTSHLEGMPLSIMEAMAKGLPVAASSVSGIPEEIGDTGHLLPDPGTDPAATVAALVRVLDRWAEQGVPPAAGQPGRHRAHELFREERMVRRTMALIASSLVAKSGAMTASIAVTTDR